MRFPKYQWMQEEPINDSCGFCDVLYKSQNVEGESGNSFQVILDTVNVLDNKFTSNPFDLITSTDLGFKITSANLDTELQLYIQDNIYLIRYLPDITTSYTYNVIGNVYFVGIKEVEVLIEFFNDVIDVNHGTTTTEVPTAIFTVANIPTGSYLNNYNFVVNITTVTPSVNIGEWFYWNNNKLNYSFTSQSGLMFNDIIYSYEQALTSGLLNIIKFYYNSVSTTFTLQITIDDGISTPTVYNPTVGTGGVIQLEYIPTNTGTHTIELILTDPENIKSGFNIERITVQELITVTDLDVEDCNGNITPFSYGNIYLDDTNDNVVLFSLNDNYPEVFRFIITDSNNNTLTSRWYKVADKDECSNGKLYSVKWTNNCNLGEIDYTGLPFTNELLLSGVLIKQQNDLLDSVENITASGSKISIYKNTQSVYEFRMHPYLADTFETILEGIFMHDTVTINEVGYNATDTVQTSELDMFVYTGRIDLYKSGSNLITKNCC